MYATIVIMLSMNGYPITNKGKGANPFRTSIIIALFNILYRCQFLVGNRIMIPFNCIAAI